MIKTVLLIGIALGVLSLAIAKVKARKDHKPNYRRMIVTERVRDHPERDHAPSITANDN
jgi:hypothetical protein